MLLIVLIREIALAPAFLAARAGRVTSVTFGVNFTITGSCVASITQPTIVSITSGFWPTAEPIPLSHIPCGHPKFNSTPSAPESSARASISCQFSFVSVIREAISARFGHRFLHSLISLKFVSIERSLISSILLNPTIRLPAISKAE